MSQLFGEETIKLMLKFSSPDSGKIKDTDVLVSHLAMNLDKVVRQALASGIAVKKLASQVASLSTHVDSVVARQIGKDTRLGGQLLGVSQGLQKALGGYTQSKIEEIAKSIIRSSSSHGTSISGKNFNEKMIRSMEALTAVTNRLEKKLFDNSISNKAKDQVGYAMAVDVETKMNKKRAQFDQALTEMTGVIFAFNRYTGKIINQNVATVEWKAKRGGLPLASAQQELIQAAKAHRIEAVIGHNINKFDFALKRMQVVASSFAQLGVKVVDSLTDIPHKSLGSERGGLQGLLRQYGVKIGTAHQATDDSRALIGLLNKIPPGGSHTLLAHAFGAKNKLSESQEALKSIRDEIHRLVIQHDRTWGTAGSPTGTRSSYRYMNDPETGFSREQRVITGAAVPVSRTFISESGEVRRATGAIYPIKRINAIATVKAKSPATTTDYGIRYGSEPAVESGSGGGLMGIGGGKRAYSVAAERATLAGFDRNATLALPSEIASEGFLRLYYRHLGIQQKAQAIRGRERIKSREILSGEEIRLRAMAATNTSLFNERMGVPIESKSTLTSSVIKGSREQAEIENILANPIFRNSGISDFHMTNDEMEEYRNKPGWIASPGLFQRAGLMANYAVGHPAFGKDSRTYDLATKLMMEAKEYHANKKDFAETVKLLGPSNVYEAEDVTSEEHSAHSTSSSSTSTSSSPNTPLADRIRARMRRGSFRISREDASKIRGFSFNDFFSKIFSKPAQISEQEHIDRILSGQEEIPSSLAEKLTGFSNTETSILSKRADYRGRVVPGKAASLGLSYLGNIAKIGPMKIAAKAEADQATGILRMRAIDAQINLFHATEAAKSKIQQSSKTYSDTGKQDKIARMTRRQTLASLKAQFLADVADKSDKADIENSIENFATAYGRAAYPGTHASPQMNRLREETAVGVGEAVSGFITPAQKRLAKESAIDAQEQMVKKKQGLAVKKLNQEKLKEETTFSSKLIDVAKKRFDTVKKYVQGSGSGSGGRNGGRGGGVWGALTGGSGSESSGRNDSWLNNGMMTGMGYGILAGALGGIRGLALETAEYAAKVQMLESATKGMAQANHMNVGEVEAQVEAIKGLNISTEQANKVVQRFMFSQLDLAKATKFVSVAQDLAVISGQDVTEVIERMIKGITTGYTMQLHRMGLMVSSLAVMRDLRQQRKLEGKTDQPTEVEKRRALLDATINEGLKLSGNYERSLLTAGGQFAYLRKEVLETQNALGKAFLPTFSQLVRQLTNGMHVVQNNAGAFAELAKILTSVGAAAGAISISALIGTLLTTAAVPLPLKILAGVIGATTYGVLRTNESDETKRRSFEVQGNIKSKMLALDVREATLSKRGNLTPDEKQELVDIHTAREGYKKSYIGTRQDLQDSLAEQYNSRQDALQKYVNIATRRGPAPGFWSGTYSNLAGSPEENTLYHVLGLMFSGTNAGSDYLNPQGIEHRAKSAGDKIIGELAKDSGFTEQEIKERAKYLKSVSEARSTGGPIFDRTREQMMMMRSMIDASTEEAEKAEAKYGGFGSEATRRRKYLATPREKIAIEFDESKLSHNFLMELKKGREIYNKGAKTDEEKKFVNQYVAAISAMSDNPDEGKKILNKRIDVADAALETTRFDSATERMLLDRETKKRIEQMKSELAIEKIKAKTIAGNYKDELRSMVLVHAERRKFANENLRDDEKQIALKQATIEAENTLHHILQHGALVAREGLISEFEFSGELGAKIAMNNPLAGSTSNAIRSAYEQRAWWRSPAAKTFSILTGVGGLISDEEYSKREQENQQKLKESLYNDSREQDLLATEDIVGKQKDYLELGVEIKRAQLVRKGKSPIEQQLAVIQYQKDAAISGAHIQQDTLWGKYGAEQQKDLARQTDTIIRQADIKAAVDSVHALEQHVQDSLSKALESYEHQYSMSVKMRDMVVLTGEQQSSNDETNFRARIEMIDRESEARKRANTNEAEDKKARNREIMDAEMDRLEHIYAQERKDMQDLQQVAGTAFDIVVSKQPMKAKKSKEELQNLARGLGRQVFENVVGVVFEGAIKKGGLGGVIPGQTKDGKDTIIGRILQGTVLHHRDTQQAALLQKDIESRMSQINAEDNNTSELKNLIDAINQLNQYINNAQTLGQPNVTSDITPSDFVGFNLLGSNNAFSSLLNIATGGSIFGNNPSAVSNNLLNFFSGGSSSSNMPMASQINLGAVRDTDNSSTPAGTVVLDSSGAIVSGPDLPSATKSKSSMTKTNYVADAMVAGYGAYQAYSGFRKGGAGGISSGIGGILSSAAGITAMIPGAQIAAPFLAAGAMIADFVGAIFGDSGQKREAQEQHVIRDWHYFAPEALSSTVSDTGALVNYNMHGQVRDTGYQGWRFNVTEPGYGHPIDGQTTYAPGSAQPVYITVHAMDAKNFMDNAGNIADAVKSAMQKGHPIANQVRQTAGRV